MPILLRLSNKTAYHIFLITLFFFCGIFAFAQTGPLQKRATLSVQKEPLENVLNSITQQTGVRFSYNSQLVNPQAQISFVAQNKTINEILVAILPSSVSFKKVGEHIIFFNQNTDRKEIPRFARNDESGETKSSSNFEGVPEGRGSLYEKNRENVTSNNGNTPDNCLDSVSFTKKEEMTKYVTELLLAAATATTPVLAQDSFIGEASDFQQPKEIEYQENTQSQESILELNEFQPHDTISSPEGVAEKKTKGFQFTFAYPIGTGGVKAAENFYHVSINLLGGVTGGVKGIELGSLYNINKYGANGAQFAGLLNITAAKGLEMSSHNTQFAGIINITRQGKSAQFAGIFNVGDTAYIQAGGIGNVAKKSYCQLGGINNIAKQADFQAGGIFNVSEQSVVQAAGIFNIAELSVVQMAGIFNKSRKTVFQAAGISNIADQTTFQAAGITNVATDSKCQIAGIVNITKTGRFQMGLVNVRDTADGVSLGLINIVKHGGVLEGGIEAGEFVHTSLTFRSGVKRLYSIFFVGINYTEKFWTLGAGLGTSFKLKGNLGLDLELTNEGLYKRLEGMPVGTASNWSSLTQLSPILNYRFHKHFKIYVGPTLNIFYYYFEGWPTIKIPYRIYHKDFIKIPEYSRGLDIWIGVKGGVKF